MKRVLDLPRNPKPVGLVALEDFFVEAQGWLELRQLQITTQPEDGNPASDDLKRSLLIELSAYGIEELVFRSGSELAFQAFPGIRPGLLNPID